MRPRYQCSCDSPNESSTTHLAGHECETLEAHEAADGLVVRLRRCAGRRQLLQQRHARLAREQRQLVRARRHVRPAAVEHGQEGPAERYDSARAHEAADVDDDAHAGVVLHAVVRVEAVTPARGAHLGVGVRRRRQAQRGVGRARVVGGGRRERVQRAAGQRLVEGGARTPQGGERHVGATEPSDKVEVDWPRAEEASG